MKIAIDISQVVYGTGVATYTRNLVQNLLSVDKQNEYLLFGSVWNRKDELKEFLNSLEGDFEHKILSIPPTLSEKLFNRFHKLSIDKFIGKVDVLHTSDWTEPKSGAVKITTIHDLIPVLFPEISDERLVNVHKKKLGLVSEESDAIIAPSKTTKHDLMKMNIEARRIQVIPEAPDDRFREIDDELVMSVRDKYKLKKEYIFSVGITKRKNTQLLIDAFQSMELENLDLVITGHPYTEINYQENVKLLGHVDTEDMPALYTGALVFVYPSLYEGFGLPILEAFACNTPVVTSNIGSMREIAQGAAVLIDPRKEGDITKGILAAIKNSNRLEALGRDRVKEYSWKRTAEETLKVYEEVYKNANQ